VALEQDELAEVNEPNPSTAVDYSSDQEHEMGEGGSELSLLRRITQQLWQLTSTAVKLIILAISIVGAVGLAYLVEDEFHTSYYQSAILSSLQAKFSYFVRKGAQKSVAYPAPGPYDLRLGYSRIPEITANITARGYRIAEQVEMSPFMIKALELGIQPPYNERDVAGISVLDIEGNPLFKRLYPERSYKSYDEVPKLVVDTLLYIEDQLLLRTDQPRYNPAVEWKRFGKAMGDLVMSKFNPEHDVHGGSTLATQKEKFRHSPDGITFSPFDKLRQMGSASLRAYSSGPFSLQNRRNIAFEYINSVPLAAVPGFGEVNGLGDGLWAYFGADFEEVNHLLHQPVSLDTPLTLEGQARVYRMVLSLFLAHRRPAFYLARDRGPLERQLAKYIPLLYQEGIISRPLYHALSQGSSRFRTEAINISNPLSFLDMKAANTVRTELLRLTGVASLYDLDRLDLNVQSTIHQPTQQAVTEHFKKLREKDFARKQGLLGFRLFNENNDLTKVVYSLTLYERTPEGNALRVQTDSFDQPFDINEGVLLDLGSTSKFRTLITYMQVIELLHTKYSQLPLSERSVRVEMDPLRKWVLGELKATPGISSAEILDRSLKRTYSGSPGERFFTASGMHEFHNFNNNQNGRRFTVAEALHDSVNLPLIRMMRDIVWYFNFEQYGLTTGHLKALDSDKRKELVERFSRQESKTFYGRFYNRYHGKKLVDIEASLLAKMKLTPTKVATTRRLLHPDESLESFARIVSRIVPELKHQPVHVEHLYNSLGSKLTIPDVSYLLGIHPFEVITASTLALNPELTLDDLLERAAPLTAAYYSWLKKPNSRGQGRALRIIMEQDAFVGIHRLWKGVGYRNSQLVPSLATSLGTSADQPAALAELMSIIMNGGMRRLPHKVTRVSLAADTPYEVSYVPEPTQDKRALSREIAERGKKVLFEIVAQGTAVRLKDGFVGKNGTYLLGGKTGTGDNRVKKFGSGLVLKASKVLNRTATFMFVIDEFMCGTITAFVEGPSAGAYQFTSSLPVQIMKSMGPALTPLLDEAKIRWESQKHSTSVKDGK
jgi:membrane peptidoglycan carboxypeptidase